MKKIVLSMVLLGGLLNAFADNVEVKINSKDLYLNKSTTFNPMYIEAIRKTFIRNHYESDLSYNALKRDNENKGKQWLFQVKSIDRVYSFLSPIYKVECTQADIKETNKNYVFIDYVQVVNNNLYESLEKKSSVNSNDFEFYKLNNFDKLISKCKDDEKCVQSYIGEFDTSSNISYEKVKF